MQELNNEEEAAVIGVFLYVSETSDRKVVAATYDNVRRLLTVCSFCDSQHFTSLESLLIQLNPKEPRVTFQITAILPSIKSEKKKILEKLQQYELKVDESKLKGGDISLPLQFLLEKELKFYIKQMDNKLEMEVLEKLLILYKLDKYETNKNQFTLCKLSLNSHMKLDQPAINSLSIFPKSLEKKLISTNSTLFDIFNKCKTSFGSRCLKRWMKQPLQNKQQIQARLNSVEYFLRNANCCSVVQNGLKQLPDLDKLYFSFYNVHIGKKTKCDITDLIKMYRTVRILKDLLEDMDRIEKQSDTSNAHWFNSTRDEIDKNLQIIGKVSLMVEKGIDMSSRRDQQAFVRPETQSELMVIAKEKLQMEKEVQVIKKEVEKDLGTEVDLSSSQSYKYIFEASKKLAAQKVRGRHKYKFLTTKQTKITFTTEKLVLLNERLKALEDNYESQQQEVLKKMFDVVAGYYTIMEKLSLILSELDVLTTYASVVKVNANGWCRPRIGGRISGTNLRHPCIKNCIGNGCRLDDEARTIVLTGPNMGGKSTYIRTIGIACYLTHIGCYVPGDIFETPIIDSIITRVGASDLQIKGISTFMSEMIETKCMLDTASNHSLVLIDQLGRGTSTSEGFGIAWAVCQFITEKLKAYCLFATHFHEMIGLSDSVPGVKNQFTDCKFDGNRLHLEYKVKEGGIEESYGIQIAKMVGFPEHVITQARSYLESYEGKTYKNEALGVNIDIQKLVSLEEQILQMENSLKKDISHLEKDSEIWEVKNKYREKLVAILS